MWTLPAFPFIELFQSHVSHEMPEIKNCETIIFKALGYKVEVVTGKARFILYALIKLQRKRRQGAMAVIHKEEPVVHNTVFGTERVNVSMYTLNARFK